MVRKPRQNKRQTSSKSYPEVQSVQKGAFLNVEPPFYFIYQEMIILHLTFVLKMLLFDNDL